MPIGADEPKPHDVLSNLLGAFAATLNGFESEWKTLIDCSEWMQINHRYVVVNEPPYGNGQRGDPRADLRINMGRRRLWVEFKPLIAGSNYWNFSKFFPEGIGDQAHLARSPVLSDIDKVRSVVRDDQFAMVLGLFHDGLMNLAYVEPRSRARLTPWTVVELARRRWVHTTGREPILSQEPFDAGTLVCLA